MWRGMSIDLVIEQVLMRYIIRSGGPTILACMHGQTTAEYTFEKIWQSPRVLNPH